MAFPLKEVAERAGNLPPLPDGYSIVVPSSEKDFAIWIELLNEEPSFGSWSIGRLRDELLPHLVSPTAASLILHEGRGVGCSCAVDASTAHRRITFGMYLYVTPKYRARTSISYVLTIMALQHGLKLGYDNLWANTYPDRLSALALYLSIGCKPVYATLSSPFQWRRVMKRLRPVMQKMKQRNDRRARSPGRSIEK